MNKLYRGRVEICVRQKWWHLRRRKAVAGTWMIQAIFEDGNKTIIELQDWESWKDRVLYGE